MKPINPDIVLKPVKEYVLMAVGMLMYSFGWIGCILPAGGVGGWLYYRYVGCAAGACAITSTP